MKTSRFEWTVGNIRIEKTISAPILVAIFFEVSAVLDVRHCPKLRSCAILRKQCNLEKMAKTLIWDPVWVPPNFFHGFYLYW